MEKQTTSEKIEQLPQTLSKIIQNKSSFCFGIDAILLANYAKARNGDKIADLGTGTGIIPILMSSFYPSSTFFGIDIQQNAVDMANRSVILNELQSRIQILKCDIKTPFPVLDKNTFDVVVSNPPFIKKEDFVVNESGMDESKMIARHEICCNAEDVIKCASVLLKSKGKFYMIHKPFRLSEIIILLDKYKLTPKKIRFVHPFVNEEPTMFLIQAVKGSSSNVIIEKPLVLYKEVGVYTDEVQQFYSKKSID